MQIYRALIIILLFASFSAQAQEQPSVKNLSFKKGEVLDIILVGNNPNVAELIANYRKTAFPVAFEYSYQPQPSFATTTLILGNHLPQFMIFGKWNSLSKRESFLKAITERVPDFHAQRKAIFSSFQLTYFELEHDLEVAIDTKQYTVSTAFWQANKGLRKAFLKKWIADVNASGGEVKLQLHNGISPPGYRYSPDTFIIAQWKDQAAFDAFAQTHPLEFYSELEHIHQFSLSR